MSVLISLLPFGLIILAIIIFIKPIKEFFRSITDSFGFTKSKEEENIINNIAIVGNAFDPNFFKSAPAGTKLLKQATLDILVEKIHYAIVGAFGFAVYKDGNAVLSALQSCSSQTVVSQLSNAFRLKHDADLLVFLKKPNWISSGLNTEALDKIINYANSLPKYT